MPAFGRPGALNVQPTDSAAVCRGCSRHQNAVDAVSVHVHDLEPQPGPLEMVRDLRNAAELEHDEPGYRVVAAGIFLVARSARSHRIII